MAWRLSALALSWLIMVSGCQPLRFQREAPPVASGGEPKPASESADRDPRTLRLATFNAGLAVGVLPHAAERAPAVVAALAREKLDVLCVQEFWHESHWEELVSGLNGSLSQRLRPPPLSSEIGAPCKRREIARAEACVNANCASVPSSELAFCAMHRCAKHALDLSSACMGCLSRDPLRGAAEIFAECVEPLPQGPARASARKAKAAGQEPRAEAASYYYGGSSGIGLLVGPPLLDAGLLRLPSTMHPRAVLYARLGGAAGADLHVFCTHLTPQLRGLAYPGRGSWEAEQSRQIDALLEFVEEKTKQGGAALVLGDLNTGPGVPPRIRARLPEHYARLIARGFVNPYLEASDPSCTYCYDNPVAGGSGVDGILIDHTLTRGFSGQARARRLMDEAVTILVRGERVATAYSDHYGVALEIDW
jgi:endonuclease/exonuclease/phosphatase family metal-dependent hydrolase